MNDLLREAEELLEYFEDRGDRRRRAVVGRLMAHLKPAEERDANADGTALDCGAPLFGRPESNRWTPGWGS